MMQRKDASLGAAGALVPSQRDGGIFEDSKPPEGQSFHQ